jgi:hypothetical protein
MRPPSKEKCVPALVGDLKTELSTPKTRATAEVGSEKRHFYKPLPIRFLKDGFNYRRIARNGNAAIYEQTWNGCPNPSISYEVIRIRCREAFEIKGRVIQPAELYPNAEAWGVDGFTFTDRDAAIVKLRELA